MNAASSGRNIDRIQQQIAAYTSGLDFDALTDESVHAAKARIIDSLGILLGGYFSPAGSIARALAAQQPDPYGASIIGSRAKCSVDMAAFVNATTARALDFNDVYHRQGSAQGHPSDVIMPVLAAAEHAHASGRDLITAVVLAYEIFCRTADVFRNAAGFDNSNFATFATAAAAGRLFGLAPDAIAHAISMAVVPNNVLRQVRRNQATMWKDTATGHAGRAGVFAALLARAGMEGPHLPFEGRAGWCDHIADNRFEFDSAIAPASRFRILDTWIRMRPCVAGLIAPVMATEKVATRDGYGDLARILVETDRHSLEHLATGEQRWNPTTAKMADHSLPYAVAATLTYGTFSLDTFDDAHLNDARMRALLPLVNVVENPEYTAAYRQTPRRHRSRITLHLKNGKLRIGESTDQDDLASEKADEEIEVKFRSLAEPRLGAKKTRALLDRVWTLDRCADLSQLPAMLAFI